MSEFCLNIVFEISELDKLSSNTEECAYDHHAHLFIENSPTQSPIIKLKVYFNDKTYLANKIGKWIERNTDFKALGKAIKVVRINNKDSLVNIDFSSSEWTSINDNNKNYENGERFFEVFFDTVKCTYKPIQVDKKKSELFDATFFLSKSSEAIIQNQYFINGFLSDGSTWSAKNRQDEYFQFGEVQIKLNFRFVHQGNPAESLYTVYRQPRLLIKHQNLEESKILLYGKVVLSLMSFYRGEKVDFDFFRFHGKRETVTINNVLENNLLISNFGNLSDIDFYGDFKKFLLAVDVSSIIDKIESIPKFVERYLLLSNMEDDSKFMIAYNLLEQFRNLYVAKDSLTQEYKFEAGKEKSNKLIRAKLREISEYVISQDKESFEKHVVTHFNTIRYKPMSNQFDNLFEMFSIDLAEEGINFKRVVVI